MKIETVVKKLYEIRIEKNELSKEEKELRNELLEYWRKYTKNIIESGNLIATITPREKCSLNKDKLVNNLSSYLKKEVIDEIIKNSMDENVYYEIDISKIKK